MFHYFQFTGSQCFGVLFFVFVFGVFFIGGGGGELVEEGMIKTHHSEVQLILIWISLV